MRTLVPSRLMPLVGLFLLACASGAPVSSPASLTPSWRRVLGEELVATGKPYLYDAIALCRPRFLLPRNAMGQEPALYVDGIAMTEFDAIRTIPLVEVAAVEFMSMRDATTRYGTGHSGGAILVWTK